MWLFLKICNQESGMVTDANFQDYKYLEAMLTHGDLIANAASEFLGDNLKLMDDMAALKPTVFCSVPQLYLQQNLEDKVLVYGDGNVMIIKSFDSDDLSEGSGNKDLWDGYRCVTIGLHYRLAVKRIS
ncbi:hypothetical protein NE237_022341 [Protea cynaroides]|uniref:Uncharacterized protein n=1 Tax=Protea cynaroides TaxID=273540 RepID=A0A9Q0K4D4_9MAGN|nr:hypothetical protein NE237_022341 [Protea cynaroides]